MKEQKGIALVTLAIAIIIVMVLAGIVISYQLGENSPIKHAEEASVNSFHDNVRDALMTLQVNYTSMSEYISSLKNQGYLYDDNQVNVEYVLNMNDCEYGNGSNYKDVYYLTDKLILKYYDNNGSEIELADLGVTMEP